MKNTSVSAWRDGVAQAVILTAAVGALFAFAASTRWAATTSSATIWRMLAYVILAGILVLLARRPRRYTGLWEVAFLHSAGAAIARIVSGSALTGFALVDAVMAVAIAACYVLARGDLAWRAPATAAFAPIFSEPAARGFL